MSPQMTMVILWFFNTDILIDMMNTRDFNTAISHLMITQDKCGEIAW